MRIVPGEAARAAEVAERMDRFFEGRGYVHRPLLQRWLGLLSEAGAGDHFLAQSEGDVAAVFFTDRSSRTVTLVLLDEDEELQRRALHAFFSRGRQWVASINRPAWDLRSGETLIPLFRACGFSPGPAEVFYRLPRSAYRAGFEVREELDGSRVDYRMHRGEITNTFNTLTPLLQTWSGFYFMEGHDQRTCRLFTASVDGQKAAVLWVLLPPQCRADQNDCGLHWKEIVGEQGVFVRSAITEEPFRRRGLGSSLHRFMLSRIFRGSAAADASWITVNEGNRAGTAMLESLGYRRHRLCRHLVFTR